MAPADGNTSGESPAATPSATGRGRGHGRRRGQQQKGDVQEDEEKPQKKRKATYLVRKEEQGALQREVCQLESQVTVLKNRSLLEKAAATVDPTLWHAEVENSALSSALRHQQIHLAKSQSLLSRCLGPQQMHPLYTRICLTKDWDERRKTLGAIREEKLRNAYEYIMARSCSASPGQRQKLHSDERFETEQGDLCCVLFDTVQFAGAESLDQLFDAFAFFLTTVEISISERLGHMTVRDDFDCAEGNSHSFHIASTEDCGVTTEMNAVSFVHLFRAGELGEGSQACVVASTDCIDEDELYPYRPRERVRKDVSGAAVLTVNRVERKGADPLSGTTEAEKGELVVTMRRADFLKLHRPEFPVLPFALQELQDGIAQWSDVMIKTIRSSVHAAPLSRQG